MTRLKPYQAGILTAPRRGKRTCPRGSEGGVEAEAVDEGHREGTGLVDGDLESGGGRLWAPDLEIQRAAHVDSRALLIAADGVERAVEIATEAEKCRRVPAVANRSRRRRCRLASPGCRERGRGRRMRGTKR